MKLIAARLNTESGATSIEYAFMLGLVIVVCLAGIRVFGIATNSTMQKNATEIESSFNPAHS